LHPRHRWGLLILSILTFRLLLSDSSIRHLLKIALLRLKALFFSHLTQLKRRDGGGVSGIASIDAGHNCDYLPNSSKGAVPEHS
jgi:hypothetical protein